MNITMLMIDFKVRERIDAIRKNARANIFSKAELLRRKAENYKEVDEALHRIIIPLGFSVIYTEEQQDGGLCAHISITLVDRPDEVPDPMTLSTIGFLFGIEKPLSEWAAIWIETMDDGRKVINALAVIKQEGTNGAH